MSATNPGIVLVKTVNAGSYTEKEVTLGAVSLQEPSAVAFTGGAITGLTNLDVYDATAAATIRQNLGLEIGVDVEAAGGGGGPIALNTGDITTNNGDITTSSGAITTNNGAITTQAGAVTTQSGAVTTIATGAVVTNVNTGAVVTNVNTGAVITNVNTGAVITNVNTGATISTVASGATISSVASGGIISAVAGNLTGTIGGNVSGAISGNVSGAIAGNVTGTVAGHILSVPEQLNNGTPVKAVAAHGHITIGGDVLDGETVTIGSEVFEFDVNASVTPGNTAVDISGGSAAYASATLTISDNATNDVVDAETVTFDGTVYEFDWNGSYTGGRTQVDLSAKASIVKAQGLITVTAQPLQAETLTVNTHEYTFKTDGTAGATTIDLTAATCPTMSALATGVITFDGETFRKAVGTLTVTAQPVQNETITLEGTDYTVKTDGTTGAAVIDLTGSTCAAMVKASGKVSFLEIPVDGQLITIGGRTYSFDDGAKTGDVKVDRALCATTDACLTQLVASITGDGSATVTAVADLDNNYATITHKNWGVDGNVAVSDNCTDGGWISESLSGGKLTGHVAATVGQVTTRLSAIIGASSTNTTITYGADTMVVTAKAAGVGGNAIVFTDAATGIGCDGGGTLGGTVLGTALHDADTFTINSRSYGFDVAGDGDAADVDIDLSTATTFEEMMALIKTAVNADGSAVVTCDYTGGALTVTSKLYGTVGNYSLAESLTHGSVSGAAMTGGVDATSAEVTDRIIVVVNANETAVDLTEKTSTTIYVTAADYGTAGNAIGLAEAATGIAVDAAVLGTERAGCDCSKEDAVTALLAVFTHANFAAASGAAGVVTVTATAKGTAYNGKVTAETMSHGAWGGNTAGGLDTTKAEAKAALLLETPAADVALTDGTGDIIDVTSSTKGVIGNLIALAKSGTNITVSGLTDGKLAGGVNGTVAAKGVCYFDASYIYIASDACTIAVDNWRKATLAVL